jgi:BMFP domain-containing protein YqiC
MQSENRFFDDLAKLVNGAAGTVAGMGREFETNARERAKEWIGGMEFVSREEFDAVKAMAAAAREEVELLKARLDALEGKAVEPVAKTVKAAKPKPKDAD